MKPAVFLDRDDTLNECGDVTPDGDFGDPERVSLMPHALEVCRALHRAGYTLVVITNQGGVARGKYPVEQVEAVNRRLNGLLEGLIAGFWYCPWHPLGTVPEWTREHPWRKPQPGMILDAADKLGLDLPSSWMIGNAVRDCEAGRAAGCRTILVPYSTEEKSVRSHDAIDFIAPDLRRASDLILNGSGRTTIRTSPHAP